eukprot:TRINITY_DN4484_c0_g1_i1.p1 TRINITY_DN4484_c0_g1~~TRINITY_DN4484_c0_g1_i1.p1  ORF type:complete len:197 (-),score=43.23 TRINITY_DN4484_c0_g1_i1:103-693(-)
MKYLIRLFDYWWMTLNTLAFGVLLSGLGYIQEGHPRAIITPIAVIFAKLLVVNMDVIRMTRDPNATHSDNAWPIDRKLKCFLLVLFIINAIRIFIEDHLELQTLWNVEVCGNFCSTARRAQLSVLVNLFLFYCRYLVNTLSSPNNFMLLRVQLEYQAKQIDLMASLQDMQSIAISTMSGISSVHTGSPTNPQSPPK